LSPFAPVESLLPSFPDRLETKDEEKGHAERGDREGFEQEVTEETEVAGLDFLCCLCLLLLNLFFRRSLREKEVETAIAAYRSESDHTSSLSASSAPPREPSGLV
jgi:hypothetical protein